MKQNLVHIPQVDLKDVKHFWVVGSQYKDGILDQDNLKVDLKEVLDIDSGEDDGDKVYPLIYTTKNTARFIPVGICPDLFDLSPREEDSEGYPTHTFSEDEVYFFPIEAMEAHSMTRGRYSFFYSMEDFDKLESPKWDDLVGLLYRIDIPGQSGGYVASCYYELRSEYDGSMQICLVKLNIGGKQYWTITEYS